MSLRPLIVGGLLLITALFWFHSAHAQGNITTIAGNGRIFRDNGSPAARSALGQIFGVAVDAAGNVYATDQTNNLVVKIALDGILTVVAGNNIAGFSGDGGSGSSASLKLPWGLAADASGNIFIADAVNCRIRRVSPGGIITTAVGNGRCGFAGDGGPATEASVIPVDVAVDRSGNLYIADLFNDRVRKVSAGGTITTVAGNGVLGFSGDAGPATGASLNFPASVAVDALGNFYIADAGNNRIRKVGGDGIISTVAGNGSYGLSGDGGPATSAPLGNPQRVAADAAGNIYIATDVVIRKVSSGGIITTVAGNRVEGFSGDGGPATAASLDFPQSVAADAAGNVYIADTQNGRIRKITPDGTIHTIAGIGLLNFSGDGGLATSASLGELTGVAVDAAGNVFIGDSKNNRVRKVTQGGIISTVAGNGTGAFSGDGGPASSASLNYPSGVAVDSAGNLYIADFFNNRVRKANSTGIITTVAGNGTAGYSGDGGPATSSRLNGLSDVAVDASGNIFIADSKNNRVRKVTPGGIISTVAGNGTGAYAGDRGPATSASVNYPAGVVVDVAGNLYIADAGNNRVRKVTLDGMITTVAGGGSLSPGDGSQATTVVLFGPNRVTVDLAGNLYIGESNSSRLRKVTPAGTITTVAGNGTRGFSGDGDLATNASLNTPSAAAVDASGNIFIADTFNYRVRKILASRPSFSLAPANLSFTAAGGSVGNPPQQVNVFSGVEGLLWTAQAATASGGNWLALSTAVGSAPGGTSVVVNPGSLPPGAYRGTVTITAPTATPSSLSVAVTLNVTEPNPPRLRVQPDGVTFAFNRGAPASTSPISVSNTGTGSLNFSASVSTSSGGGWLSVAPASGAAVQAAGTTLTVTATPGSLDPGTYTGQVSIASTTGSETLNIPVTMTINSVQQTILLSRAGLTFKTIANGGVAPQQTLSILNSGQGVMTWSASASTLSGGNNWLVISPSSGSSDASATQASSVQVGINAAGLAPGTYYGEIQVSSAGADNSPQIASIVLNILPEGSNPGPIVQPTGLIFTGVAGGTSPGSQEISITNLSGNAVNFSSGRLTLDGANWFTHIPTNDTIAPNQPGRIVVQPDITGLAAGVKRGVLTLLFTDGTVQPINLLFVVTSAAPSRVTAVRSASDCTATTLYPLVTSIPSNFSVPTGWPNAMEVRVIDNCGNPMTAGSVRATFNTGDQPVFLASVGGGLWSGTWQARNVTAGLVTVTVIAEIPGQNIQGSAQVTGALTSGQSSPVIGAGAIVSAAAFTPQIPLAPGGLISIFGARLSETQSIAESLPLQNALAGASVSIGGQSMPLLYASDGQLNAMVPYSIPVNTQSQIIVRRGATASVPEPVTVAAAQPAVFTRDQTGKGQGLIFVSTADGTVLADASRPATAGDAIVIYCSGLGEVNPAVPTGVAAPSLPLSNTVNSASISIGGKQAQVLFAGLAPGFAGLYQVNAVVPQGIDPGNQVPLIVSLAGQASPPVTMAVQ